MTNRPHDTRDRLAEALLDLGTVSSDHLKKAEALRSIHGGGLDTAVLEIGVADEAGVLEALSRARGATAVDPFDLREIPAAVLRLLPAKAAHRLRAVPFRAAAATAYVAVLDARDLRTQDELAFVIGRRVRLFVTTETRLVEALVRHYGGVMPSRFRALLERLPAPVNRAEDPSAPEEFELLSREPLAFAPRPGEDDRRRRAARLGDSPSPPEPTSEALDSAPEASVEATVPAATPSSAPPAPSMAVAAVAPPEPAVAAEHGGTPPLKRSWVVPLSEAERARLRPAPGGNPLARERDAIAERLLRDLLPSVERAVLLRVRGTRLEGWRGAGVGIDPTRLGSFATEASPPSLVSLLASDRSSYIGPVAHLGDFRRLSETWGGGLPGASAVLALRLRNRLGALLYLDRSGPPIDAREVGQWEALCDRAARRLETCLLRGKHRQS